MPNKPEARLRLEYCPDFKGVLVFDREGFLCSVTSKNVLWEMLRTEEQLPGINRIMLENLAAERKRKLHDLGPICSPIRYDKRAKRVIDLEDLKL